MTITNFEPYQVATEGNIAELLAHFDSDYILQVLQDKLNNLSVATSLTDPNFVAAFEENFKLMNENFPGDSENIRAKREEVYTLLINMLCQKFNLEFNTVDPNIDIFTAAYHLYDFLVNNRNNHMVRFFTLFIINNKESLYQIMNTDDFRKNRDTSGGYSRKMYEDQKLAVISSNMNMAINYISTLDIRLLNIFQSIYPDQSIVAFMDNAFRDRGNFFAEHYCTCLRNPEAAPVIITNIRLSLQRIAGSKTLPYMDELIGVSSDAQ